MCNVPRNRKGYTMKLELSFTGTDATAEIVIAENSNAMLNARKMVQIEGGTVADHMRAWLGITLRVRVLPDATASNPDAAPMTAKT